MSKVIPDWQWLICIDWLITSAVALCLSDVIQDQLTVTYVHWLFDWFSSCVSDWYNTCLARRFWDFVLCLHWLRETLFTFLSKYIHSHHLCTCWDHAKPIDENSFWTFFSTVFCSFYLKVLSAACFLTISKWIKQF